MEVSVIYKGSELLVVGDFTQAYYGGRDNESISESFETYRVCAGDVDITELLSDEQLNEIDIEALDALN